MLRHHHFSQQALMAERVAFVVRKMTVEYYAPARLDDMLEIQTEITSMRGTSLVFTQRIVNAENTLLNEAEVLVVCQMMLDDPEMREMAQDELREAKEKSEQLEQQLQVLLLPKDPDDERNAFLEVRAGTGGDEAALFAGDLFRMYSRYGPSYICVPRNVPIDMVMPLPPPRMNIAAENSARLWLNIKPATASTIRRKPKRNCVFNGTLSISQALRKIEIKMPALSVNDTPLLRRKKSCAANPSSSS